MPSASTVFVDTNVLLLTQDLQHDLRVDKLRILNPFRSGPEVLDAPALTP